MGKLLEVCVDSYASAMAAIQGGADRLELCGALSVGGLTPSAGLLHQIRLVSDIQVRCLMRPRAGDFLYTKDEISQMVWEMEVLKAAGTNGFVIGCLTPEGELDEIAMAPLLKAAQGFGLTLHRCIDVSRNLGETYKKAAGLGFDTVLTSGGAGKCLDGMAEIGELLTLREEIGGPQVLIGAGVNARVIGAFRKRFPQAEAFHMSGKKEGESGMMFRREGVPMGAPGLDEWHIPVTSQKAVEQAKAVLNR